jgi:hypothetical protein
MFDGERTSPFDFVDERDSLFPDDTVMLRVFELI